MKKRGSFDIEIKGLITRRDRMMELGNLVAPVEIWGKWAATTLDLAGLRLLSVCKRRWIRRFVSAQDSMYEVRADPGTVAGGGLDCDVELTLLSAPDHSKWWTLGLEAHGVLEEIEVALTRTVATLEAHSPPPLPRYPAWLSSQLW